jgi:hypothetical protein
MLRSRGDIFHSFAARFNEARRRIPNPVPPATQSHFRTQADDATRQPIDIERKENGRFRSITEIAEAEKIDRSFVSRLLDLTLLAPDIQEAILEGRQAKGMQLEELTRVVPGAWEEQRHFCSRR